MSNLILRFPPGLFLGTWKLGKFQEACDPEDKSDDEPVPAHRLLSMHAERFLERKKMSRQLRSVKTMSFLPSSVATDRKRAGSELKLYGL